ncbi:MAG: YihA family ribosome biogenesis GTP-binding protein [Xanthomonadales bacterium]|nr:YihA family ribosome biogenesis GTP-binding protein [Xanthomonadales bacterium]
MTTSQRPRPSRAAPAVDHRLAAPFRRARFALAAAARDQLPPDLGGIEVAFAGRSNAGKSSAINVICDQNGLARTSKTPGRTQQLVLFEMDDGRRLMDLPGYGYAKVPVAMRSSWRDLVDGYLRDRQSLSGLVILSDIRQALTDFDQQMLQWCAARQLQCLLLLTKADKLSRGAASARLQQIRAELGRSVQVDQFSALKKDGVDKARRWIAGVLQLDVTSPAA